jgi:hypothetical protein
VLNIQHPYHDINIAMSSFEDVPQEPLDNSALAEDQEAPPATEDAELCPCQKLYEQDAGNQKKIMYLMCIGLRDCNCDVPLFCFVTEQWSQLPKTALLRPKTLSFARRLHDEQRCSTFSQFHVPVTGLDSFASSGSNKTQFATKQTSNSLLTMKWHGFATYW